MSDMSTLSILCNLQKNIYCWAACEQNRIANSIGADDLTDELAIIASNNEGFSFAQK